MANAERASAPPCRPQVIVAACYWGLLFCTSAAPLAAKTAANVAIAGVIVYTVAQAQIEVVQSTPLLLAAARVLVSYLCAVMSGKTCTGASRYPLVPSSVTEVGSPPFL